MWPETEDRIAETMAGLAERAAADRLLSRFDPAKGREIKHRSLDAASTGVLRQDAIREASGNLWIEPGLWSGVGLARSGCGSAIVGDPDQVLAKLERYMDLGIRAFILSGYPHLDECDLFAKHVLPRLRTCRLNEVQGRRVRDPVTPLTTAPRA
jgi:alkanesulfonate monooxygenase